MQDKLQLLTDKLYNEGLAKGREDGDKYLENARSEAEKTISEAQAKAQAIIEAARAEAAQMKEKAEADIRTASQQSLQALRSQIENLLIDGISAGKVDEALSDPEFIKTIITAVTAEFGKQACITLPESLQAKLEPWVKAELGQTLGAGVQAKFSSALSAGFTIGPADGSYYISMSDEAFRQIVAEYLRPATRKLLFG